MKRLLFCGLSAVALAGICAIEPDTSETDDDPGGGQTAGEDPAAPSIEDRFAALEARVQSAEERAEAAELRAAAAEKAGGGKGAKRTDAAPEHMAAAPAKPRSEAEVIGDAIFSHLSNLANSGDGHREADDRLAGLFKVGVELVREAAKKHWGLNLKGTAVELIRPRQ